MRTTRAALLTLSTLGIVCGTAAGVALGGFNAITQDDGNDFAAVPDFVAPTVTSTTIAKATGFTPGFIRQGGSYYVYANVSDTGNPASGVGSVAADVSSIDTGQTSVALTAGSFSVGGVTYNRRSAALTANASLPAGTYTYSLTASDNASNTRTEPGFSVTVDNTLPSASDIQSANGASITGRPELNDRVTYTYSEPIDPPSILSGWSGAQTDVVVRINNNAVSNNDALLVYNASNVTQLPLGTVNLGRADYVGANRTFGVTGTKSKMTLTGNSITVVLGTASGTTTTATANGSMIWTPSTSAFDRAGNASTATARTETGTADREF